MSDRHVLAVDPSGGLHPLVLDGPDEASVASVARVLGEHLGTGEAEPALFDGTRRLAPSSALGEVGLVQGALLGVGRPVSDDLGAGPASGAEAVVVSGLHAGGRAALAAGAAVVVGRGRDADLAIADPEVSRRHAVLRGLAEGVEVADAGSHNGTGHRGVRLAAATELPAAEPVSIGASLVEVRPSLVAAPILEPAAEDGTRRFNRPPRIVAPLDPPELVLPTEPKEPTSRRIPVAGALLPLVFGAGLYFVIGPSPFLLFMLLSPVMLGMNAFGDRRHGRKEFKAAKAAYEAELATVTERLAGLVVEDERQRRRAYPDPAEVTATALAPGRRLWERRATDPDHLLLRAGTADRPARVRVVGGDRQAAEPPAAHAVPVTVDLVASGVLGVAAERPAALAAARALLVQVAALHGPRDVRLELITAEADAADWAWFPWLPHAAPLAEPGARRLVAIDREQAEQRLGELGELIAERTAARRDRFGDVVDLPRVVVVLDGARRLRHVRGVADVLRDGPAVGVFAVCLDVDEHSLPSECRATIVAEAERPTHAVVRRPERGPVTVLLDGIAAPLADRVARALAPLRDLGDRVEAGGDLPRTSRFTDLVGLPEPDADAVLARWAAGGRSTRAVLGESDHGPFSVDLRRDGPHALVAGTTGSGKSELLQTLVASLALANTPEALSFVLVDYKGGAAFRDCARLPHCAGLITDLDGHLVGRALASLDAELERRERLLLAAGAKDIDDLVAGGGSLARLVIVIDEFASLVEEVPEFVTGVVGIGMRGRSLGVHVVLATQRPAGAVTADLRANVNLRLCLRVADPAESSDVLDVADAADIPRTLPGRALARTGLRDLTPFQAARVGGPRRGAAVVAGVTATDATLAGLGRLPLGTFEADDDAVADADDTDLARLVDAIGEAAAQLGAPEAPAPWLPPLPEHLTLAEVGPGEPGGLAAVVGLADRPTRQAREPFVVDLEAVGNLAVLGAARTGRTTLLRTLVAGLATAHDPRSLHVYGIDGGSRGLVGIGTLAHAGAVVPVDDLDRVERLVRLVGGLVDDRQRDGDPSTDARVVLLVDGHEAVVNRFLERDGGWVLDDLDRVAREGPSVGVHVVLATDRTGFSMRLASAFPARLVLRQADRDDDAMVGLDPRQVPQQRPAGRAIWAADGMEVQIGLLADDASGPAQDAALVGLVGGPGSAVAPRHGGPRRVDPLAEHVELREVLAAHEPTTPSEVVLGLDGDGMAATVDLADLAPGFVVAGPPLSGRSTALAAVVASLPDRGDGAWEVVVVTPRRSPLADLAGPGVVVLAGAAVEDELEAALDDAHERATEGVLLVVDDAELLADGRTARILEARVRTARDDGLAVVAAATTDDLLLQRYRGWLAELRRARTGLLLAPASSADGEVFDLKLARSTGGTWPAGRGLLVRRGRSELLQVGAAPAGALAG
ncbi:FHA domain-containing protein [Aquihabitans sp. G128]|uniref:FtsK/SpoIIIE domain-containing protein n=1 Tax=Aquihabitans sp. G128 TaxID=2849779 RepID=UPI001C22E5ED|nr:FtsK/SpoIIIE domain-containing protein [Aquihabitans sp. G128]QXC61376.1 FHA domain-containing protein [Aquihabitans sp. G128]